MDVPFSASNALSRHHYSLIRNVENAQSMEAVDRILSVQIDSIRDRLRQSSLSLKECKECLVILLYCAMTITVPAANVDLTFALPQAINLAEAGISVMDKRVGYLFCTQIMPPNHSLQLLLVNTLRKDLEHSSNSRICLALDVIIQSPFEELIPAVQTRLYDIISHNSEHVRKRALLALRTLAGYQQVVLEPIVLKVRKRLHDSQCGVASAALIVFLDLVKLSLISSEAAWNDLNELLLRCWKLRSDVSYVSLMTRVLRSLICIRAVSSRDVKMYKDIFQFASRSGAIVPALAYESIVCLSMSSSATPPKSDSSLYTSLVSNIRHLLTSEDQNELYLFLCILEVLEPSTWAGTVADIPAVLDGWEVERIMQFLDSRDALIRVKTLRILYRVDQSIVESYFSRMLESQSVAVDVEARAEYAIRLLQVSEILSADDGELYARNLKQVLRMLEDDQTSVHSFAIVVEQVLMHIRQAGSLFRISCTTALLVAIPDPEVEIGSTFMIICAALCCEHSNVTSIPPFNLLQGFADRLYTSAAPVKEACLITMLRLAADCGDIPTSVLEKVNKASEAVGTQMRRRYNQFKSLVNQKDVLQKVISSARSSTLPDFVSALDMHDYALYTSTGSSSSNPELPSSSLPILSNSSLGSKLRYAAYEKPRPTSRLSARPSLQYGNGSHGSDGGSSRLSVDSRHSEDAMSKTITAGELTLIARTTELEMVAQSYGRIDERGSQLDTNNDAAELSSRMDLIALDSPFPHETEDYGEEPESSFDFEATWNALKQFDSRGWCELTIDGIVRGLQGLHLKLGVTAIDQMPFKGDLKVVVSYGEAETALLRLRESDDDESCLWRMRCEPEQLRVQITRLFSDRED